MTLRRWIAATMLATAGLPARGEEATRATAADSPDTALVLAVAPDEAAAEVWVERWNGVRSLFSRFIDPDYAFPETVSASSLGLPDAAPGSLALVLGFCSATEAAPRLEILKSINPEALSATTTPRGNACPGLWGGTRLRDRKTIDKDGWKLVVSVYQGNPPASLVPVGRKNPPSPDSGELFILTILFDPDGKVAKYENPMQYHCVTDELEWPNTCDLKLNAKGDTITVDMKWGQRTHPCSGDVASRHVRSVFTHAGRKIIAKKNVLEETVVPMCD